VAVETVVVVAAGSAEVISTASIDRISNATLHVRPKA